MTSFMVLALSSEIIEELLIDVETLDRHQPELISLEHVDKRISIDQLDRRNAISSRFFLGFDGKGACGDDYPFICTSHHCATEISNMRWRDDSAISLALKEDVEAHERIHLQSTNAVDTFIAKLDTMKA